MFPSPIPFPFLPFSFLLPSHPSHSFPLPSILFLLAFPFPSRHLPRAVPVPPLSPYPTFLAQRFSRKDVSCRSHTHTHQRNNSNSLPSHLLTAQRRNSPLHAAATKNRHDVARHLIDAYSAELDADNLVSDAPELAKRSRDTMLCAGHCCDLSRHSDERRERREGGLPL